MRIQPEIGPLGAPFWRAAKDGRLVCQQCSACRTRQHPPLPQCASCGSSESTWVDLPGEGTLYAFTVVHHATHVAFADRVPYTVGLVDIVPGVRLTALIEVDSAHLHIGMPLRAVYREISDEASLVCFVAESRSS